MKPLMIELFAGLHGWGRAAVDAGYRVIGFDIVDMCAATKHPRPAGVGLVIQDVRTLDGSRFKDAAVIVASPPCHRYSYMLMPWSRARNLASEYRSGVRSTDELNALFLACWRIQREASEAARRHIPLIVENVRGAQAWVGPARGHCGAYYLWGDVPALAPDKSFVPGIKQSGSGRAWFDKALDRRRKGTGRKSASARAAMIPYPLARHIAEVFKS
jgi:hypothetical protein